MSHSYLGDSLEDVHKRVFYEDNEICTILIYILQDVVLFPGETLALRLQSGNRDSLLHSLFMSYSKNSSHIGIINHQLYKTYFRNQNIKLVGTTAEIQRKSNSNQSNNSEIVLVAQGKRRFRVLSCKRIDTFDNLLEAKVQIYPEYDLKPNFLNHFKIKCKYDGRPFPNWVFQSQLSSVLSKLAFELFANSISIDDTNSNNHRSWGEIIHDNIDEVTESNPSTTIPCINKRIRAESDPIGFAFYLSANLPMSNHERQDLLQCENVIERLR